MFTCYYDFIPVTHSLLDLHQHPIACRYIDTTYIVLANDQYIVQNLTLINLTGIPGFPCCPGSPFSPYKYKYVCVYNVTLQWCICICSLVHVIQLILSPGPPSLLKLRARACMQEDEAICSYTADLHSWGTSQSRYSFSTRCAIFSHRTLWTPLSLRYNIATKDKNKYPV